MEKSKSDSDFSNGLTPDIMEGYLQGTLSAEMRQKVEKYLKENPFEAEAVEGLRSYSEDLRQELAALNEQLSDKIHSKTRKPARYFLPAAAAISLLLVSGLIIYLLLPGQAEISPLVVNQDTTISQQEDKVQTTTPDTTLSEKIMGENQSQPAPEITRQNQRTVTDDSGLSEEEIELAPIQEEKPETATNTAAEQQVVEETIIEDIVFEEAPVLDKADFNSDTKSKKSAARSAASAVPQYQHQFNGLPGAQPPTDWHEYLSGSLRYPEAASAEKIKGSVKLAFRVNTDGSLSDIEVVQELGYGCDQEAVRVLENGPAWQPATVNNIPVISTGEIEISFPPDY